MIIECIKCTKKFDVNSDLIPEAGRTIICGSCDHTWFFNKSNIQPRSKEKEELPPVNQTSVDKKYETDDIIENDDNLKKSNSEIIQYNEKSKFTVGNFLSYVTVIIISLLALFIILDTFKELFYKSFPKLEFFLFSLYETLKDIQLFIKDLI
tara:strand:+ start:92 stop:547 length:456 start_codon:yes stop_codon:yes gene_type:complete